MRWRQAIDQHLGESCQRLEDGDCRYFAGHLPSREHWRLFPEFRGRIAYLDIETTGMSGFGHITTIALYDGQRIRHYVHGENLEQFGRDIGDYELLVTYSGKCFDLPFIRSTMGLPMDQAHIDLRYVLKSLGYGGGLKGCEKKLGLDRGELDGVDGFMAVLLWRDYLASGNPRSLETLLAYNIQDVVNLETLAWRRHSGYCCRQTLVGTRTQGRPGAQRRSRCLCVSHPPCTRQVDQLPALPHR